MSYVQPIGWHNELVPPSLQIFTNGCIFIFNVGENSQRFRLCNKLGLGKIRYIFLTSLNTLTFCGLPSLILSLDGCNVEHVTIFGPPNTRKVVYALLGTFLELKITTTVYDVEDYSELVKSHGITVYGIPHKGNIAYIAKWDDIPGTFNPDLAMELGVPKGPEFGRLKKGHSVQLPNGQMVHSSQVCGEGLEGTRVLITDCKAEEVSLYLERAKLDIENIYYIFYLADPGNVPENLKHVLCDQTYGNRSYIPLYPSACRNYAYNETFPHAFPKPIECRGFYPDRNLKGHSYPPLTKFYMHPINSSIDTTEVLRETFEDDMIKYSDIENVKKSKDSLPCTWESTDEYRFIFLGTGCSYPSVYRNVSAILLHMKNNSFLFDAGEGTILQLLRSSSDHKDFVSKLISIRTIFISHSHADHHLGLYSLLAMQEHYRRDAMDDSVTTVIAPKTVYKFLTQYKERIMDINYDFVYTGNSQVSVNGFLVDMFNVIHIEDSFGVKVSHPEIGKVVYSGDTRPCENLIRYAQGVDFLIHEATFTECDFDNAVKSNHSTFLEALEIAKKCSVKTLILTHFSQRYQELGDARYNAILAHDLMSIPLKCGHNS